MAPHPRAHWALDLRGEGRAVRVAAHVEAGFLVLSTWKSDECVSTVRLIPGEAAELMAGVAACLAELASGVVASTPSAAPVAPPTTPPPPEPLPPAPPTAPIPGLRPRRG